MNEIAESNIPTNIAANIPSDSAANLPAPVPAAPTAPSFVPGWKTTEFWMAALGQAGLVFAAASGALPPKYAALAGVASQVAYSLSRSISKAAAAR